MNYRMIIHTLGWILLFEAAFLLVPLITALVYSEWSALWAFLISIFVCLAGGVLFRLHKPKSTALYARDGFVIVAFSWILLSVFGAVPFMLTGATTSYVDALFETASGFTTTGASIFPSVEALPKAVIMWRSFTHWVGGMGVLVFMMAFLRLSGGQNMYIMKAESPGPTVSKLVPKVRESAFLLYAIYFVMTLIQIVFLLCGGMSVFDALNTAFSTAGTGGFGFRNDGMASFSPYIQIVVSVFMLLFSINFASYFLLFRRKYKEMLTEEVRTFLIIVGVSVLLITLNIKDQYGSVGEAARHAFFSVSSLISTTGFATENFDLWPSLSKTLLVLVMFIGACAGSTGGGIKISRIIIMFKTVVTELGAAISPKRVQQIRVDGQVQDTKVLKSVLGYLLAFVAVFVGSLLVISIDNADLITNFTAVTATINNVGPGLSNVGPVMNYAFFSPLSKLVLTFDMLAGRLEFFPILLLLSPKTWKK